MNALVPEIVLTVALWAAVLVTTVASVFLLVVLVKEWRDGTLW